MAGKNFTSEKIKTPVFRVSFPSVLEPTAYEDSQAKKYSCFMLFERNEDLSKIKAIMQEAAVLKWGDKIPENLQSPIKDGNSPTDTGTKRSAGYEDTWFIKASNRSKPGLVDQSLNPITSEDIFYAGCYAHATISAWTSGGPGTKYTPRINFNLINIQKVRDGEPFGFKVNPSEDFEPLDSLDEKAEAFLGGTDPAVTSGVIDSGIFA